MLIIETEKEVRTMDTILWLGLMVLFLIMEANTVSVVSIWFAMGALAALVVSLFVTQLWIQAVVFVVVSALLLACLRPMARKYFKPKLTKTNVDAVIGTQGYITDAVDNLNGKGQVKLGAMGWTARSTDGSIIPQGTLVKVDRIEGVKAFVTPVEVKETV